FIRRIRHAMQAFRSAQDGNVVITFALALIPIVGIVGSALDYSRANSVKAAMQAALDATALGLFKNAATLNHGQLQQSATAYFGAEFHRPEARNVHIRATYSSQTTTLTVTGSASIKTTLLNVIGFSKLDISTSSSATRGITKLRVALVLDNTGS